jgi:nicotinate phosphoribosyltransferase
MGFRALGIVMKLTHCNGQPVAKLSDSPGKTMCSDETFLAYLRQVFNVPAPGAAPAEPTAAGEVPSPRPSPHG